MRALVALVLVAACLFVGRLIAIGEPLLAIAVIIGTLVLVLYLNSTYAVVVSVMAGLYVIIPSSLSWDFSPSWPLLNIQRLLEVAILVGVFARWPLVLRRLRERTMLVAPWAALFVLAAVSSFWSESPTRSVIAAFGAIEAPAFAMLLVWSLRSQEREALAKTLMVCAVLFALVALYQVISGMSLQDMIPGLQRSVFGDLGSRKGYLRAQGLMPNAIVSGAIGAILFLYGAWRARTDIGWKRSLDLLGAVAGLILVVTSQSRVAFFALGVGIGTMLIVYFVMKSWWKHLAVVLLLISVVAYLVMPQTIDVLFGAQTDLSTGTVRLATATAVWNDALDSPTKMACGVGWGTFMQAGYQGDLFGHVASLRFSDNLVVKVFAELGMLGVIILATLGICAIISSIRRSNKRELNRPVLTAVTASFLAASLGVVLLQLAQPMFAVMAILALLEIGGTTDS